MSEQALRLRSGQARQQSETGWHETEKEALANQKLAVSLTPLLIQQAMIDKLSSKIQEMVVPQGQNYLMQLRWEVRGKQAHPL